MSEYIITESKDKILRIEIKRPKNRNAITRGMYASLASAIEEGENDPKIRVILLHGQQDYFTAGNDLKDFQNFSSWDDTRPSADFMKAVITAKKPLIVAVGGYAIGIGTTMLFHFDLVYAGDNARFQLPFVNLGLCPEFGSSFLIPRLIGPQRAKELLFFGESFNAEVAKEIGLINKIFPKNELLDNVMTLAKKLAEKPPAALRITKDLVKKHIPTELNDIIAEEGREFGKRLESSEAKEAFKAFYEHRTPDFSKFD